MLSSSKGSPLPMAEFSAWTAQYVAATPTERAQMLEEGIRLAKERRPVFKDLIKSDPRAALENAVPMVVRQQLPTSVLSLLETRINEIGALRVLQGVPMPGEPLPMGSMTFREAELKSGKTYRAYVYGEREQKLTWTAGASLNGVVLDSDFAVNEKPTREMEIGEKLPADKPVVTSCPVSGKQVLAANEAPAVITESTPAAEGANEVFLFCDGSHRDLNNQTIIMGEGVSGGTFGFTGVLPSSPTPSIGVVRVLAIPMTYADQNGVPSTEAQLYATLRDVAEHYAKSSYGRVSLVGVVSPPVKLKHNEAWYVNRDTSNGGDISGTSVEHQEARDEARKLGFDSNDYDCIVVRHNGGPGSYGGLGGGNSVWVRGDGNSLWAHEIGHCFGLAHSNFWTTAGTSSIGIGANEEYGDSYDIMGGAGMAGQYNAQAKNQIRWLPNSFLQPVTQSGLYRIYAFDQGAIDPSKRYAMTIVKDSQRTYWGMVRSLFDTNPWMKSGLELGWRFPNGSGSNFQLIDTTNGSPFLKEDAPISLGNTFSDTEAGIHMTTVAVNDNPRYVDVQVNMGAFPTNHAPTLALAASADVVPLNATVTFTATATDEDGDTLAYAWQHFGNSSTKIVSPNSNVITRQFTAAGTYVVTCTVSDMKGGTVTRNQLITVGASSTFTISGRVTLLGAGLQDVVVMANNANGVVTDADGYFTIPNLSANTYTLTALLYGYSFSELFNNSITVGPSFSGASFEATAQSVVTITAPNPNANELAPVSPATFRLTRSGDNSQALQVNVNAALGSATKTTDYSFSPDYVAGSLGFSTFTIPADSSTLDITVTPVVDAASEGPETVLLQLGPGNGYLVGSASSATVVIADDDSALPKVSLTASTPATTEGSTSPAVFTIARTGAAALTVNYVVSGTAASGSDFTALAGSVTIPAGATSADVNIVTVNDSTSESLETVVLTLTANAAYLIDPLASTGTASIYDDDLQTVNVTASDPIATEVDLSQQGAVADTGTFLVSRSGDTTNALTVYYAFSGTSGSGVMALHGADYNMLPGSVVIPAGQSAASITITPRFDGIGEGPEQVVLTLGANATNYLLGTSSSATVTINDSPTDVPYIDVVNINGTSEPSTSGTFRFTVRGSSSTVPLPVNFTLTGTAVNGTDYDSGVVWAPQASGVSTGLRAVWGSDASNVWAVGDGGVILKWNGTTWTAQTSGTTNALRAVWGTSATSVWAVGDNGTVLKWDGSTWNAQTSGTTNALRGVWGLSATSVWAVGDNGTILKWNGTTWAAQTSGVATALYAVWGFDTTHVWAVGAGGVVRFWNNATWAAQTSGTTETLRGVWGTSATSIWACGTAGKIIKGSGTTWSAQTSNTTLDLTSIWGSDANNLWASGNTGTITRTTNGGSAWTAQISNAAQPLSSIRGTDANNIWAVGDAGVIMNRSATGSVPVASTIVIPPGASTYDLVIRPIDDVVAEDVETITLSITPSAGYSLFNGSSSVSMWLKDNDTVNTVYVDTQVGTGGSITMTEGATTTPVKFYVSRTGSTAADLTVNYTLGGTATSGSDYTALSGSVIIPAGSLGADVPVPVINDTAVEGTETIIFNFAPGSYSSGPSATMYIADNEANTQTVAFTKGSAAGLESVTSVNVPVTLASPATSPVTVEYAADSGTRTSATTSNTTQPLPYWVRMVKTGTAFASYVSSDGQTWGQLGATQTLTGFTATSYLAGLCVCSGADGTLATVTFDNLSITGLSAGGSQGSITSADIGAVAATGSYSVASGTYTVAGSGADIWNTVDEFRYVWFPITTSANCTITARVTSQTNTSAWAKAGVMIRESSAAGSRQAMTVATPGNGRAYQYRGTTSSSSTAVTNVSTLFRPLWVRLQRAGDVFTASQSTDGSAWTTVGTPQTMALAPSLLAGLAVSARDDNKVETATFDNVSLTGNPALVGRTVGFVNTQGTDSLAGGIYTVNAAGSQIGGSEDECHFVSAPVSGDFTLVARVLSQTGGATNMQAGVMVRESTNYRVRSLYMGSVANAGTEFISRSTSVSTAFGSGVDYSLGGGVLNFAVGDQTKNIVLAVTNDSVIEPDNNISIVLRNPNGAQLGSLSQFTYTILDDDVPPATPFVGFAASTSTIAENGGAVQIAVSLSYPAVTVGTVDYTTTDGTALSSGDYTATAGTLAFAPGESVKYISVPITDDAVFENTKTFTVTLSNPANMQLGSIATHSITVNDDDSPVVTIVANDASAAEAGLDPGQFTISRTGPTTNALVVNVTVGGTAASGSDFNAINATQTIPAGSSSIAVNLGTLQDTANEGSETVIVTVAAGTGYAPGTPASATVSIADDDRSTVTIAANDPIASETPGNPGQFTVTRTAPLTASLTVNLTIAGTATNSSDYALVASTLVIPANAASAIINITPVDDANTEGPEDVTISLNTGSYDIGAQSFDNVTIADNDNPPTVFINSPTSQGPLIAASNGIIVSATVSDDGAPNPVTQTWSLVSGPGAATIESPNAATTAVTFSAPGTYVLRISATDGQFTVTDQVTVVVGSGLVASNWFTQDLGPSSARRGQGLEYNGIFSLTGTGAGYSGTDQAHIMVRSAIGDGSVVARLTSLPTSGALAGVTIRDSLARSSRRAVLGYVPGTGLQFRTRDAAGTLALASVASPPALPIWLKLERNATTNEITASYAPDVSGSAGSWTVVGTPVAIPLLNTDAHYGLTATSNSTSTSATGIFDNVTLTPTPSGPALLNEDSGTAPNLPGSGSLAGSTYTVAGSPTGYFYGWQYYGDMVFTARLASFTSGAGSSSGGIRIAESIESGAYLHLGRMPTGSYNGYYWTSLAGGSGGGVPSSINAGNWMRIVRRGNSVTGYRASDVSGSPGAWIQIGQPQTVIMTTPLFVGFYVNNASGVGLNTCTFSGVSITALNKAPVISATATPQFQSVTLDGTITDDSLPADFTSVWSQRSGPSSLVFANPNLMDTTASFSMNGAYGLRLTADDTGTKSFFDLNFNGYTAPFTQWLATTSTGNPNNAVFESNADSDGDGLMNLLEYAIGTNGTVRNANPQVVQLRSVNTQQYLRLTIPKNPAATDVTFVVEASSDLVNWSSLGLNVETDTSTQLVVRDNVPVGPDMKRFMRVRVTRP